MQKVELQRVLDIVERRHEAARASYMEACEHGVLKNAASLWAVALELQSLIFELRRELEG